MREMVMNERELAGLVHQAVQIASRNSGKAVE